MLLEDFIASHASFIPAHKYTFTTSAIIVATAIIVAIISLSFHTDEHPFPFHHDTSASAILLRHHVHGSVLERVNVVSAKLHAL